MAYEDSLDVVNGIHDGLVGFIREVSEALTDGNVSLLEGMGLGVKGLGFASLLVKALQGADRAEVLRVLEYGDWVLNDEITLVR